jgi:hypothetical protein
VNTIKHVAIKLDESETDNVPVILPMRLRKVSLYIIMTFYPEEYPTKI